MERYGSKDISKRGKKNGLRAENELKVLQLKGKFRILDRGRHYLVLHVYAHFSRCGFTCC